MRLKFEEIAKVRQKNKEKEGLNSNE